MAGSALGWGGFGIAGLIALALPVAAAKTASRPTESFRAEHKEIRQRLARIAEQVGALAGQPPAEQRKTAGEVVQFFREHLAPHAAAEEHTLYPLVDRLAGGGAHRFTATMRYEHRIVERWVGELAAEAARPAPDYLDFARKADNLLGLIDAHFEEEEQVLLPLIDHAMTKEQFEKEMHPAH